jgi:acetyltransferase-like isoleucine patch superfamily enzyme
MKYFNKFYLIICKYFEFEGLVRMQFILRFFYMLKSFCKQILYFIEIRKYNNYTIAEYFRKRGAQIGEDCYIVPRQLGGEPYLVKIGNHVAIAEGVKLHNHDGVCGYIETNILILEFLVQ